MKLPPRTQFHVVPVHGRDRYLGGGTFGKALLEHDGDVALQAEAVEDSEPAWKSHRRIRGRDREAQKAKRVLVDRRLAPAGGEHLGESRDERLANVGPGPLRAGPPDLERLVLTQQARLRPGLWSHQDEVTRQARRTGEGSEAARFDAGLDDGAKRRKRAR